jgi:hypothetical protein
MRCFQQCLVWTLLYAESSLGLLSDVGRQCFMFKEFGQFMTLA